MMNRMQAGVATMQTDREITYLILMDEREEDILLLHCKHGIK